MAPTYPRDLPAIGWQSIRSDSDQRRIAASDKFFEHAAVAKTQDIYWGRNPTQPKS